MGLCFQWRLEKNPNSAATALLFFFETCLESCKTVALQTLSQLRGHFAPCVWRMRMENQKKPAANNKKITPKSWKFTIQTNTLYIVSITFFFSPSFPEGALTPPATPREAEEATGPGSGVLLQDSKKDFGVAKLCHIKQKGEYIVVESFKKI